MLKKTIVCFALLLVILIPAFHCAGKSAKVVERNYRDTIRVLAIFKSAVSGVAEGGFIRKVYVPDTLTWKMDGSDHQKLTGGPDSFYLITYNLPITDSLGGYVKDSLGRVKTIQRDIPTDKKWIRSGFENADSAAKELNELK